MRFWYATLPSRAAIQIIHPEAHVEGQSAPSHEEIA
jgi:hypothetical protein